MTYDRYNTLTRVKISEFLSTFVLSQQFFNPAIKHMHDEDYWRL